MGTFRDDVLDDLDDIRGIPGDLGMRLFSVEVLVRTWTGTRVGVGSKNDTRTGIMVDRGGQNVRVRNVTSKDVVASGGLYTAEDIKVGPFTPPFAGSAADGNATSVFDPDPSSLPTEVFFIITGPGYPADGAWFKKISQTTDKPLSYMLFLRKTAKAG